MGQGPDRSELPAPYRNPWALLARDLRAVAASLRLKAQEIWRRNGEGDLAVPGFWPRRLAAWFWPLLLLLLIGAVVLLLRVPFTGGSPKEVATNREWPWADAPNAISAKGTAPTDSLPIDAMPIDASEPPGPVLPAPSPATPGAAAARGETAPEALLQLDPLLALLADLDPEGVMVAVRPKPALGRLELELNGGFTAIPLEERSRRAQRWLGRSLELGYGRLELVDPKGRLWGRSALVGSGMIMLDTPEGPPDDAVR